MTARTVTASVTEAGPRRSAPVERHRVTGADGLSLSVLTAGDRQRPAVLALHGWPGLHTDWMPVIERMGDVFWIVPEEMWYQHFHQLPLAERLLDGHPDAVRAYLEHFYCAWSGSGSPLSDEQLSAVAAAYSRPGRFAASIAYYRARAQAKLAPAPPAERLTPPAFVAWGEEDPVMPIGWSDRLDEHFELNHFERVAGAGHFLPLEAPDLVARTVRKALQSIAERSARP